MQWYKFVPIDTLYFKGAQPMNMGENHTASHIFPPPVSTLTGALRTAVLATNGISLKDYVNGKAQGKIYDAIGEAGEPAPFNLIGPLFMFQEKIYVPAPYSWFVPKESNLFNVRVIKGKVIESALLKTGGSKLVWARHEKDEVTSIGGKWISKEDLNFDENRSISIKITEDFFENEPRTGIALQRNRRVREGHLYTFNHTRLKMGVALIFATDRDLPLPDQGVLKLGAEQRFGWYEKLTKDVVEFNTQGNQYMSLSIQEGTREANEAIIATGKILYLGGWDLKKGFHKPMKGYFPAGSVFSTKINQNFIPIKGVEKC